MFSFFFGPNIKSNQKKVIVTGINAHQLINASKIIFPSSRLVYLLNNHTNKINSKSQFSIQHFFLPDLLFVINEIINSKKFKNDSFIELKKLILTKTWLSSLNLNTTSRVDLSLLNELVFSPKSHQKGFLEIYNEKVSKMNLEGYILAFEQGLGKTFTSLALMHCLKKDCVIIVCPKSLIRSVWKNEIETVFKQPQHIYCIGDSLQNLNYRFYIFNYESLDKFSTISHLMSKYKNIGIIVDEVHNFKNTEAKRVIQLEKIKQYTRASDVLLMSGTPVKAMGTDLIPTFKLIDPMFTDEVQEVFIKAYGFNRTDGLEILKNRLGLIMHRKLKTDLETLLPEKQEVTIKIKMPTGNEYIESVVKRKVREFVVERKEYYSKESIGLIKTYFDILAYFEKNATPEMLNGYDEYKKVCAHLHKNGYDHFNLELKERVKNINLYETNVIQENLPSELKKKFKEVKSVYKYVELKINGEVIGRLLGKLRQNMFAEMLKNANLCTLMSESEKKVILFTTYKECIEAADSYVRNSCNMKPVIITGENSKDIQNILKEFKTKSEINPLIAMIQTLSTGVTLTEASTIIFLNKPWRHVDYLQSSDRVHRIGQDTPVKIITLVLDTGDEPNLSTKLEDVVNWSKEMFTNIVG